MDLEAKESWIPDHNVGQQRSAVQRQVGKVPSSIRVCDRVKVESLENA
jgi:hypothetical protein